MPCHIHSTARCLDAATDSKEIFPVIEQLIKDFQKETRNIVNASEG